MSKGKRSPIKAHIKHSLMDECDSACAECRATKQSTLEFHHIDGDRSWSVYENLIVLCSSCHSEFSRGGKSEADALLLKRMAQAGKLAPRLGSEPKVSVKFNSGVVAGTVGTVNLKVPKSGLKPIVPGTIGADADTRSYADYLVKKYIDWRKKSDAQLRKMGKPPKRSFAAGAAHSILGEGFGVSNSVNFIAEARFFDWVRSAQSKIDRTVWGRTNRYRNYHTWEEHLRERHG